MPGERGARQYAAGHGPALPESFQPARNPRHRFLQPRHFLGVGQPHMLVGTVEAEIQARGERSLPTSVVAASTARAGTRRR